MITGPGYWPLIGHDNLNVYTSVAISRCRHHARRLCSKINCSRSFRLLMTGLERESLFTDADIMSLFSSDSLLAWLPCHWCLMLSSGADDVSQQQLTTTVNSGGGGDTGPYILQLIGVVLDWWVSIDLYYFDGVNLSREIQEFYIYLILFSSHFWQYIPSFDDHSESPLHKRNPSLPLC